MLTTPREALRRRLAALPGATEEYPFQLAVRVFKVGGKMFAVTDLDGDPARVTLKGDPDDNEADRAEYPAVRPGWHMNKRHWNTVTLDGSVPDEVLAEMIRASHALVVRGLPRAARPRLLGERSGERKTMTTITLTPDLETALARRAETQGTTPELLALDGLRQLYGTPEPAGAGPQEETGETLFDFLKGHVGTIAGSTEALSENGGERFASGLTEKHKDRKQ